MSTRREILVGLQYGKGRFSSSEEIRLFFENQMIQECHVKFQSEAHGTVYGVLWLFNIPCSWQRLACSGVRYSTPSLSISNELSILRQSYLQMWTPTEGGAPVRVLVQATQEEGRAILSMATMQQSIVIFMPS